MSESNYLNKLEEYLRKQNTSKKSDTFKKDESSSKILYNKSISSLKENSLQFKSFTKELPIKENNKMSLAYDKSKSVYGLDSLAYETRNYNNLVEECLNFQDVDTKTSYDIKSFLPKDTKAGFKRKYDILKAEYLVKETENNNEAKNNVNSNVINKNPNINTIKEQIKVTNVNRYFEKEAQESNLESCCINCKKKFSDNQKNIDGSYLKESVRSIRSDNEEIKEISFFEIYHENDYNNIEINPNRELEWIVLEQNDKINNELINAFLDFEI